jgi:hypothetical protein
VFEGKTIPLFWFDNLLALGPAVVGVGISLDHQHQTSPRTLGLSIISAPSYAATRKWMESVLNQRSSNDSPKHELVGAKYQLNTNTSPRGQEESGGESPVTSPITSPPYWVQSHQRSASAISIESIPNGAITLQDNTDGEDAKNKACWAKSVYIEDHVVINGSRTGIGAFVVWNITVETLHVSAQLRSERIHLIVIGWHHAYPKAVLRIR